VGIRDRDVGDDPFGARGQRSATSTVMLQPPPREELSTVAVTAEIPIVASAPERHARQADGSSTAPVKTRRLPAPVPLRQAVWFLAFVLVLCGIGLWGLRARPAWFAFARNQVGQAVPSGTSGTVGTPVASSTPRPTTATQPRSGGFRLLSSSTSGPLPRYTYSVGSSDYAVTISTSARCWVVVKSPADALGDEVEIVEPAGWHGTFDATAGSLFVEVAARGATIAVDSGSQVLGTIAEAPVADYTFQP
jgi:hypothetical protein